jgi:hypothetical protein
VQTLNAPHNLTATDAKGDVKIGDGIAFRNNIDEKTGTPIVVVEQAAELKTSNLKGLNLGDTPADTQLTLDSTSSPVTVDDKTPVTGTQLALTGRSISILGADDPLVVDSLQLNSLTTFSDVET